MSGILGRILRGLGIGGARQEADGPDLRFAIRHSQGVLHLTAQQVVASPSAAAAKWQGRVPDPCRVIPEPGVYPLKRMRGVRGLSFGPSGDPMRHEIVGVGTEASPYEVVVTRDAVMFLDGHVTGSAIRLGREPRMVIEVGDFDEAALDAAPASSDDDTVLNGTTSGVSDDYARTLAEQESAARLAGLGYVLATDDASRRDGRVEIPATPEPVPATDSGAGRGGKVTGGGDDTDSREFVTAGGDGAPVATASPVQDDFVTSGGDGKDGGKDDAGGFGTSGGDAWSPSSGGYGR